MNLPKNNSLYNKSIDEKLFGNKRFLIIEQLNCLGEYKIRKKIYSQILIKAINSASEEIQKRKSAANYIFVNSRIAEQLNQMPNDLKK